MTDRRLSRALRMGLAATIVAWPVALAGAWFDRATPPAWPTTIAVELAAAELCHRQPERSFHTQGLQWPVCARCAGLYVAAPFGALAALAVGRPRRLSGRRGHRGLAIAVLPLIVSWALEAVGGLPVAAILRTMTALPAGAAIAWAAVGAVSLPAASNQVD
jgi:uncharacterized membrane protein